MPDILAVSVWTFIPVIIDFVVFLILRAPPPPTMAAGKFGPSLPIDARKAVVLFAVAALSMAPAAAFAQGAASIGGVDVSPIVNIVLQLIAMVLLAFGAWAVARAASWLKINSNSAAVDAFDDALAKAIAAGLQSSTSVIAREGWDSVNVKNATLAAAAPILIAKFPDALKGVGLDPDNPAQISTLVDAALDRAFPEAAAKAAASPATPPVAAAAR